MFLTMRNSLACKCERRVWLGTENCTIRTISCSHKFFLIVDKRNKSELFENWMWRSLLMLGWVATSWKLEQKLKIIFGKLFHVSVETFLIVLNWSIFQRHIKLWSNFDVKLNDYAKKFRQKTRNDDKFDGWKRWQARAVVLLPRFSFTNFSCSIKTTWGIYKYSKRSRRLETFPLISRLNPQSINSQLCSHMRHGSRFVDKFSIDSPMGERNNEVKVTSEWTLSASINCAIPTSNCRESHLVVQLLRHFEALTKPLMCKRWWNKTKL